MSPEIVGPAPAGPPVPPPGPGVQVPFPAPPSDRDRRRLWIGLGLGGALLAVCCFAGIFGFGALIVQVNRSQLNEARSAVTTYLGALRLADYPNAYDQLCERLQGQMGLEAFETSQTALSPISDFTVGQATTEGTAFRVNAQVVREDGEQTTDSFLLIREGSQTSALKICGIA